MKKKTITLLAIFMLSASNCIAGVFTYSTQDAWNTGLAINSSVTHELLEDEPQTASPTNSLTLRGSNIDIDVTAGNSASVSDFSILNNRPFETIADDGSSRSIEFTSILQVTLSSFASDPQQLTFTLPSSVNAVSLEFDNLDFSNSNDEVLFSVDGIRHIALDDFISFPVSGDAGFFGYVDTQNTFSSFTITHESLIDGGFSADQFQIGSISSATFAPVPEPSTLSVWVCLAGVVSTLRRRKTDEAR